MKNIPAVIFGHSILSFLNLRAFSLVQSVFGSDTVDYLAAFSFDLFFHG